MQIELKRLMTGQEFSHAGDYYIKTDIIDSRGDILCVNRQFQGFYLKQATVVYAVQQKLQHGDTCTDGSRMYLYLQLDCCDYYICEDLTWLVDPKDKTFIRTKK